MKKIPTPPLDYVNECNRLIAPTERVS